MLIEAPGGPWAPPQDPACFHIFQRACGVQGSWMFETHPCDELQTLQANVGRGDNIKLNKIVLWLYLLTSNVEEAQLSEESQTHQHNNVLMWSVSGASLATRRWPAGVHQCTAAVLFAKHTILLRRSVVQIRPLALISCYVKDKDNAACSFSH